ncbi:AAA family ATPase [Agrobacterium sp. CNPSo 3708]|uniref:AAA family ATPase n=1 Tax=Agrobacterium sp. CNPSo 3708 TaxID=3028150 RepID=UPI002363E187|nr:AAA family ATPase [Agrobacterium sp. CNPSo 3708]MDD1498978.1 AAA family ATPase [Agrobacterium sp. CNPSo 3708]
MIISQIEVGNFRKLHAARIDLSQEKTVFVGANNSGKTSAMTALRRFLVEPREFSVTDFTLSNWSRINAFGDAWEKGDDHPAPALIVAEAEAASEIQELNDDEPIPNFFDFLPHIDVWLDVADGEMHYVRPLIPTLDWESGLLGVRLRFEPDDLQIIRNEYCVLRKRNSETIAQASFGGEQVEVALWPETLMDFLERRIGRFFRIKPYLLDPNKLVDPIEGVAHPQALSAGAEHLEKNPLEGLIRVNEINAQRGLGQQVANRVANGDGAETSETRGGKKLSTQLRSYYDKHLDPTDTPELDDLKALQALSGARRAFDDRLTVCFANALKELEFLGYPGVTDPKLRIATNIRLQDGLNHASAVQYHIPSTTVGAPGTLPEDSNGLGYQNLVSMVFALMSFRDGWMKVGKAGLDPTSAHRFPPPLHLVLIEEPEAHLHAQVQQVFMKHAFKVLRNHDQLMDSKHLRTQLVVSTHSSHIAHSSDFESLRYFRRLPASRSQEVPTACVINLKNMFGPDDKTGRFVKRYLKATHCDLFFADGAVLIEGSAERILVPHFVETRREFEYLRHCYISWLEIGGSHAHRLRSLIEHLGLITLIITDLDAKDPSTGKAVAPRLGDSQEARNETLRNWIPAITGVDDLVGLSEDEKVKTYASGFSVRSAYQTPVTASFNGTEVEALSYTFEDALFFKNIPFFRSYNGTGLGARYKKSLTEAPTFDDLVSRIRTDIAKSEKAEFALNILYDDEKNELLVPDYIASGLTWLTDKLRVTEESLAPKSKQVA